MYFCALPVIFSRPLSTDTQNELKRLRLRGRRQKRSVYAFWPLTSFHSVVLSSCSTPKAGNKWSEPLKWHTELGTVSGKGKDSEEKAILPEISADGRRTHENLRTGR